MNFADIGLVVTRPGDIVVRERKDENVRDSKTVTMWHWFVSGKARQQMLMGPFKHFNKGLMGWPQNPAHKMPADISLLLVMPFAKKTIMGKHGKQHSHSGFHDKHWTSATSSAVPFTNVNHAHLTFYLNSHFICGICYQARKKNENIYYTAFLLV